jgi:hypothetical protein
LSHVPLSLQLMMVCVDESAVTFVLQQHSTS